MTDAPVPSPGTPHELLADVRELTRRVRTAQRGSWFPLLLLGALTLGAIPVYRFAHYSTTCRTSGGMVRVCTVYTVGAIVYWSVALVLAYAATAVFYVRRSRARGVGTTVRPYIAAGIGIAVLVTGVALWVAYHPPGLDRDILGVHLNPGSGPTLFLYRLAGPASAIGLALLVLAWAERDAALLAFTLGYLTIVLVPVTFGWSVPPSRWSHLPHLVITGVLLLLGGLGSLMIRRPRGAS